MPAGETRQQQTLHVHNPFIGAKQTRHGLIFAPSASNLNLMLSLRYKQLCVLLALAAQYDADKGRCIIDRIQFMGVVRMSSHEISKTLTQLQKMNLIARCKAVNQYWLNPNVFLPIATWLG